MFKNYLKTAWRNIKRTKSFSLINILGLSVGMTACLFILHYIEFEQSYDSFHKKGDRIYRLRYERESENGSAVRFASCCPPAGALIRERYTQVEKLARIFNARANVSFEDKNFFEKKIFYSDPQFFEIFDFDFVSGDPVKDLSHPGNAFVSQSIAQKYFGDRDPIGLPIDLDKKTAYRIAGVFKDFPGNSHIKIDILLPLKNFEAEAGDSYMLEWGHTGLYTYILLKPDEDPAAFEKQLTSLVTEQVPWLKEYKMNIYLKMQPLKDIHLTSHFMQEYETGGDKNIVHYLFIIALFIIVMAWVNYINLSTARSLFRAKEVGLRKVVGASRGNLLVQFFFETVLLNIVALGFTFLLLALLLPVFNDFTGLPRAYSFWTAGWFWYWVCFLLCGGILLSGLYPVFTMISFKITSVLKGRIISSPKGIRLRKALITFQFGMALILLVSTITIFDQIEYLRSQDLGFDMEQILVFSSPRVRPAAEQESFNNFRAELLKDPQIIDACHVTEVPGRQTFWDAGGIKKMGEPDTKGKNYQIIGMDYHFADVFDLQFAAGRNFSPEYTTDDKNLIFNEAAVKWLGLESPDKAIGQKVDYWGEIFTIVGVLKDFHQQSLKNVVEPHIYRFMPTGRRTRGQFAVKLNTENTPGTIARIKTLYQTFFPDNPFDYFFLDDYYNQQYKSDELFGRIFRLFSALTIFITAMGLFGLSSFNVAQRTREIGIRKVLGSSVTAILVLLSQDYFKRIVLAFIFACPVAWYAINQWLDSFASRINLSAWPFLVAMICALLVAALTISGQAIRAATANPVEALRYE